MSEPFNKPDPINPNNIHPDNQTNEQDPGSDQDSVMEYLEDTVPGQTNDPTNANVNTNANANGQAIIIPGIDLGTTNSCISIWRNNNCEIIPDEYGNKTIPSFVSYTNVSKYVGIDAKNQQDINVENVFYEIKRLIGRNYDEKHVQACKHLLSYKIIKNERQCISLQSSVRDNKIFTPEEISASVLMKLKDMASRYLKQDIKDVVITVPAHFNDSQRHATQDAASIAGLNCVRMFNEPTAAALAYGMMDRSINKALKANNNVDEKYKGMIVLVYDFGGGTLDVSIIDIFDGCFDVKGSSGISHFGGVDFDNRLINYCIAKFSKQYYGANNGLPGNQVSRISLQKLRTQCESAKKILSTNTSAFIAVKEFHNNLDLFVKISRYDFENLCRDLFILCMHSVDELLVECDMTHDMIDEVVLVGGMTRMPYIREMLNNKFKNIDSHDLTTKVNCSINPDEAVAVGAAIQGYIIAHRDQDDAFSDSVTLMDVTPLSLGVEVIGGVMDILIKRNTMIPCDKIKLYSTDTDYIDSILVKIFEGERAMTAYNHKLGEFELDKIPKCQRGIPEIEICFAIDLNGMVTVSAFEKDVNEKKSITVNINKNGLKPHQLAALIEEAMEQETLDEIDRVKKFSYYEMEDLCANIYNNINNKEFKLTKRDILTITEDITMIRAWLKEKSYRDRDLDELNQALHKMKKKYGVLILHGKIENDNVKASADHIEATTLFGKDDDEEEEEMRQAFEKVVTEEIGGDGMSDTELSEIKELRNALIGLCGSVNDIMASGKMNITEAHKHEILHYIDDVMLWYYSHKKPTKIDYKEKIDYVNSLCDEIIESYGKENKELFIQSGLDSSDDTNSQKLEKLCLTIITMVSCKQIIGSRANLALFVNKIQNILNFVYTRQDNVKQSNPVQTVESENNNMETFDHIQITDVEFQDKCMEYIDQVNTMCNDLYNKIQGIDLRHGPTVTLAGSMISVPEASSSPARGVLGTESDPGTCVVTDQFDLTDKKGTVHGMSIMELMRMKQNEEIEEMIERQLIEQDSCQ
jgi:heat shock 70kDa protein 1/2/6/8